MTQPMKILVALNVATLVVVVLLGAFVVVTASDANQKIASISAALPAGGVAGSAAVQGAVDAAQKTSQSVAALTAQVADTKAAVDAMTAQLTAMAAATAVPAPGASSATDGVIAGIVSKLETLQTAITHIQDDLTSVRGFVQSVCTALGRC